MKNKAQITLYMILGFVILIASVFIIYLKQTEPEVIETAFEIPFEKQPIKTFVEECTKQVATLGIYLLGSQGGYIYPKGETLYTEEAQIAYNYYNQENLTPTKKDVEDEISFFIENSLNICLDDFKALKSEVEVGELNAVTKVNEENIAINLDYPITLLKDDSKISMNRFSTIIPVRLGYILDLIKNLIQKQANNDSFIEFGQLTPQDIRISILPYDGETIIYSILDDKLAIKEAPFVYRFAYQLEPNSPPTLDFIPDFVLGIGTNFTYALGANDPDNDSLIFYTESALVNLDNKTGVLNFKPSLAGDYSITVGVKDPYAKYDERKITFIVQDE